MHGNKATELHGPATSLPFRDEVERVELILAATTRFG